MHQQALLAFLSATPLFAAPVPQDAKALDHPTFTITSIDTTAIKARGAVGNTLEYPPFKVASDDSDFVRRGGIKLSSAPIYSPVPDSFVKRQEGEAEAASASWDPYCIPGGSNCGLIVDDATAVKRSEPPVVLPKGVKVADATYVKRQEADATAMEAALDPYCRPDGTNCGLDVKATGADATAITARQEATIQGDRPNFAALGDDARATAMGVPPEVHVVNDDAHMDATAIKARQGITAEDGRPTFAALGDDAI
ncbi:uncharacterized protein AB675_10433 [Cyphellophora attinorum]|uniref:Uncharacterized protein n=1 Tax=Cyphellophora attinorum TaxID=1664694 RepID=A0A0N1H495_9EURO|nr:uncharacterized protein AB675_10433 [Phialophora attinorum]KPI35963.1 hypothetical protein AB675_10433 [Phialophora attinorum]